MWNKQVPATHDPVMERIDEEGHILGSSALDVSRFKKDHPELVTED